MRFERRKPALDRTIKGQPPAELEKLGSETYLQPRAK